MTTTTLTIITKALQKNGVMTDSEVPSDSMANDGLDALNAMLGSWSNDSLSVYARTTESFTLVSGTASYTIGASQTFNTTRPIAIIDAYTREGTTDTRVEIITDKMYYDIADKSSTGQPKYLNYDNGFAAGTIRLYPSPDKAYSLYLLSEKPLSALTLNQTFSMPPGWERAMIYNLAMDLAPDYGQAITNDLKLIADQSKASIMRAVLRNRQMQAYPQPGYKGNIINGW